MCLFYHYDQLDKKSLFILSTDKSFTMLLIFIVNFTNF